MLPSLQREGGVAAGAVVDGVVGAVPGEVTRAGTGDLSRLEMVRVVCLDLWTLAAAVVIVAAAACGYESESPS